MSLLEILKTDVGGQEVSKRIFDNFRPIIHFDGAKTEDYADFDAKWPLAIQPRPRMESRYER